MTHNKANTGDAGRWSLCYKAIPAASSLYTQLPVFHLINYLPAREHQNIKLSFSGCKFKEKPACGHFMIAALCLLKCIHVYSMPCFCAQEHHQSSKICNS